MTGSAGRGVLVASLGSRYRRDDGVGERVVGAVAASAPEARTLALEQPLDLLEPWAGRSLAVVVDATSSGALAGTVRVLEVGGLAAAGPVASSHVFGLADVFELARLLGVAPARLVVVGIEGRDFRPGVGLSSEVEAAVPLAAGIVAALVGDRAGRR